MNTFIEHQIGVMPQKKFDSSKKVSCYWFRNFKEVTIRVHLLTVFYSYYFENADLRAKLLPASFGQTWSADASHFNYFANQTNVGEAEIDAYLQNSAIRQYS
jgi:hypothetical protein